jgi:hypothetical protein
MKPSQKIRVVIDGVVFQTTARMLRIGAISHCLYHAFCIFEAEHKSAGIIGHGSSYWDASLNRNVQIQFDLY